MSLQLHRPDGQGGLEARPGTDDDYRSTLRSGRWGAALRGGRLPELRNTETNPASTARSLALWLALGLVTFAVIVVGYGIGFWS